MPMLRVRCGRGVCRVSVSCVPNVARVPRMADIVSAVSGMAAVATMPAVLRAVPTVRQPADGHDCKSHGASRQRDKVEVHAIRDTTGPRAR